MSDENIFEPTYPEQQEKYYVTQDGSLLGIFVDFPQAPPPHNAYMEVFSLPQDARQKYDFTNNIWKPLE